MTTVLQVVPGWARRIPFPAILNAALVFGLAGPASGQAASACSYTTCALRVESGFLGSRLVQGSEGAPVARLGFLAPEVDLFAERSPEAGRLYAEYGSWHDRSTAFGLLGAALLAAAWIAESNGRTGWAVAFGTGSVVGATAANLAGVRARNRLSRAVWTYNGALPREDGVQRGR